MDGVTQKVLSEQLRELMADGLVISDQTGPVPSPVRYSLTTYGRSPIPVVETIRRWGRGHIERIGTD